MMIRLRVQFAKLDEAKYISHLDLMRALSRTFRRAEIPIGFSQGYNPHHLISMGGALAVGLTSTAEYMDLDFSEAITPEEFLQATRSQMPPGLELIKAEEISTSVNSLMAQINIAVYLVKVKTSLEKEGIEQVLREFKSQKEILVTRVRKKKVREVDLKPLVHEVKLLYIEDEPFLQIRVQTGSKGNARPEEVMEVLARYDGIEEVPLTWMHRQGLYVETEDKPLTPFEAARISK